MNNYEKGNNLKHWDLPYNPNLKDKAKQLRKAGNLSEVLLWNELKGKKLGGYDFHRQKIIGDYIVDFFCPYIGLIIEVDGNSHNYKYDYDLKRDEFFRQYNLTILHIKDIDIFNNLESILIYILNIANNLKDKKLRKN